MEVPLHEAAIGDRERDRVAAVLDGGEIGSGEYDRRVAELLTEQLPTDRAMLTTSCTHALEMAAMLLEVGRGDEVVMPSWTFPATANAFVRRGAEPVFVDVDPETLTMDVEHLETVTTRDTAAIVPVHYGGVSCDMDGVAAVADEYDVPVVEDAAQGVDAEYDGTPLGTIGDVGCYSFDWAKNYTGGEAGALLLDDERFVGHAEVLRRSGTNYAAFSRDEAPHYEWVGVGSRYKPSELQAALVYTQLRRREEITAARESVHERYMARLPAVVPDGVALPSIPADRTSNYHLFPVRCTDPAERAALSDHLDRAGVGAAPHYRPLHSSEMGAQFGYEPADLPVTETVADTLLRLPIHPGLSSAQVDHVVDTIEQFYADRA